MKTYYCKNGETVYVFKSKTDPNQIVVRYKGKEYIRPKTCIGQTLFEKDPSAVCIGSKIILTDVHTGSKSKIEIIPNHKVVRYSKMGGAYYGAGTEIKNESNAGLYDGEYMQITDISPIGKAAMEKRCGEEIDVTVEKRRLLYRIEVINNDFMKNS